MDLDVDKGDGANRNRYTQKLVVLLAHTDLLMNCDYKPKARFVWPVLRYDTNILA